MLQPNPKIDENLPRIRQLDEAAINKIAAGEVVERPASAVKELIENAIDASANQIRINIAEGGKTLIQVTDNGCGITPQELPLAISRHATSKIDGNNLFDISSFGFRGEALPSLGAVGRLNIVSRVRGEKAAKISVSAGKTGEPEPAALDVGTIVELRDLFFATPARLKFMKSDRAETKAITDTVRRLSIASPNISFVLNDKSNNKNRVILNLFEEQGTFFEALHSRLSSIMGKEFIDNAVKIEAERNGFKLSGYVALPTYSRGTAITQYFFVNGRPVHDKILVGSLKAAYSDLLPKERHAAGALFVECPSDLVDVNVHPAKSEVRFRESGILRGLIISAIKHALAENGCRTSSTISTALLGAVKPESPKTVNYQYQQKKIKTNRQNFYHINNRKGRNEKEFLASSYEPSSKPEKVLEDQIMDQFPLGAARTQLHENYIIAQTCQGLIIVDQHAAHERLVYEDLKKQAISNGVISQSLLIPEIIEMSQDDCENLLELSNELAKLGLTLEPFGGCSIAVRAIPAILGDTSPRELVLDIRDELLEQSTTSSIQTKIDAILSTIACHSSIRSGRSMRLEEMNALLRKMENTAYSGQCNHGRPTYIELKLGDIKKLFGRK